MAIERRQAVNSATAPSRLKRGRYHREPT
jgi:hypothetical protein